MFRTPLRAIRRLIGPTLALAIAASPALLATAPARAQFGDAAQFGRVMSPYYLRRDIRFFVDELQLDEEQQDILETLYFDYEDAHQAAQDSMVERFKSIKDEVQGIDPNNKQALVGIVLGPFMDRAESWNEERFNFLNDVRSILAAQQQELWPAFMRALRREKELPQGQLSAESTDLFTVMRQADVPAEISAVLAPQLDQYELDLDAALSAREAIEARNQAPMMASLAEPGAEAIQMLEERLGASIRVRDINLQYARILTEALPSEFGERFSRVFREIAFPSVARPTAATRIFERAIELETIDDAERQQILDLFAAYRQELRPIIDRMIDAMIAFDPLNQRYKGESFVHGSDVIDRPTDPVIPIRMERNELDKRYMAALQDILTRSEFLSLPGASRFVSGDRTQFGSNDPADPRKRNPDRGRGARGVTDR